MESTILEFNAFDILVTKDWNHMIKVALHKRHFESIRFIESHAHPKPDNKAI